MTMRVPVQARALRAVTILVGGAVVAAATLLAPYEARATLALLLAGVVLAELLQITSDAGEEERVEPAFSFSSAIHLAAVLLLGVWAAVLVAAVGVITVDRLRGSPWGKVTFNAGVFALAALAGGLAYAACGGHAGTLELPGDFAAITAAAVAYGTVNVVLVTLMIAFWSGVPMRGSLHGSLTSAAASSTAEAAAGVLLTLSALAEPWAIAAVVPLVVVAYQAHARLAQLRRETTRALETFANVIDERDSGTYRHSARVAELVRDLARDLRLPARQVALLGAAGRLHDLGKIAVDASVLRKPGKLNADEWAAMRRHPRLSARLLRSFEFASSESLAAEYHHERYDGLGYYRIERSDIPLAAHFLAVVDTFDAMCSDRPYRQGLSEEEALAEIERNAGTQFHPAVAKAFVAQQRGNDPVAALSPAEYQELRRLTSAPTRPRLSLLPLEVMAALALALGFAGAGFGRPEGLILGGLLAAGCLGLRHVQRRRGNLLAETLRRSVEAQRSAPEALAALVEELSAAGPLRWAGVVEWRPRDMSGSVVLSSGAASDAPGQTALTSWLVREGDTTGRLLRERHGSRSLVAVRLQRDGLAVGYLTLLFDRLPRPLELALVDVEAGLASAFGPLCGAGSTHALVAAS